MRVLLSTFGSRGDVQPLLGLAARLHELAVDVLMCAPPEFTELAAEFGVPTVPVELSPRAWVHGAEPLTAADAPRTAAQIVAMQFGTVAAAAKGCDALVATGLMPAGERTVAEILGIPYVYVTFIPYMLPSPSHPPMHRPGRPFPPGDTDNRVLWEVDAERIEVLYGPPLNAHRMAMGLPPVVGVRDHVFTHRPWLAADPVLGPRESTPELEVVQTGAWLAPDPRPLPDDVAAFLGAGTPPVFIGLGSMRAPDDVATVAIEAIRALGHRTLVSRGWADLCPIDDRDDCFAVGEVDQQALFRRVVAVVHHGGAGTTTAAALAGAPQVVIPQLADQPYWAGRVADLGIGAAHDGPTPSFESLSAALRTALTPGIRARAIATADLVRTDGATVAAQMLLDVMTRHPDEPVTSWR